MLHGDFDDHVSGMACVCYVLKTAN